MEGALYFPYIQVPNSAWFTRSLLYWDQVGTIVPDSWIERPEALGEHTLELVRRGLVRQVLPGGVALGRGGSFHQWLNRLSDTEIERRRERLRSGEVTKVHVDKWLMYEGGIREVIGLGLAERPWSGPWVEVEPATANEFMAALTLELCHPEGNLSTHTGCAWLPATNVSAAFRVLLTGLARTEPKSPADQDAQRRVRGELDACEVRTSLLEKALPVPDEAVDAEKVERIRRKHGDMLPRCRRHIEELIDRTLEMDEVRRLRAVDRMAEEVGELSGEAEAYLREAGIRRVARSPLIRMLKFVPLAAGPVSGTVETAQTLETAGGLRAQPLAYLALARAELGPDARYRAAQRDAPLIKAFGP